ncbi:transmembrane protein, putative (macronuclear) [Tetrahymena thermophila SB210]|uniref:Transmembrane protein, putative n=1 Tax=Tetrahymena thermophila (strain SB210) TaxID=312017 RepID=I7M6V7_TETTS|nr:transmembrane protein, putative [Tetrahymena thermophila SB210]EAR87345.1 transmembrane protein, putative [Tetrahymena thermophila SB210]|eukprot:XP_001007590.1 transmembrane protein, putative [Tetrahymena thermophila SB210]
MKKLDLFGSQILFRFNREPAHQTYFGSIFTLAIVSIVGLRLILIITSVVQRTNPVVIYQERQVDSPKLFTINQNTFQMAFGMQDPNSNQFIDEQVYNITVQNIHKTTKADPTTGKSTDSYIITQVPLTRCSLANFPDQNNLHYYQQIDYTNMYCFPLDFDLQIEGDFSADSFQYININIQKCSSNCKPDDYIQKMLDYSFFSMQFSDIIVDPTQKTNPFKHYSRDTFFSTSLQMPKQVAFYMRNNYVESDYGWITSDIETVDFPSFSYAESNVYPSTFQDFFFSLIFRFEKQKESLYTRKYQNLNDIISQIGGFSQSLLAIGFLICSRLSQLDLNKEIINEAFNYENVNFEEEKNFKMFKPNDQNEMAAHVQQNISPPISQDISFNNIPKHQTKQFFKQDQPCVNQSDNKGSLIKPISINPNQSYINNNNQLTPTNGNINQNNQQSFINQANQSNNANQNLATKRYSFRNNFKPENQMHDSDEKKGLEDMLSSKQYFLQILKTVKSNKHKDDCTYQLSQDHQKLKQQQQKLEEKEQKLKESFFKRLMQKATSSMTLNTFEYLKFFLWPFGQKIQQKKKVIDYSINQLYQNLDVLYVIKKLMEVDKLKNILLNPDQLKLFEYIPKPTIRSNYGFCKKAKDIQFEIDDHYQDNRTELQKVQQAYQSYQNIANKQNLSALDVKILQLLDQKLLQLFGFSQNQRDSLIQNIQLIPQNIEVSQYLDPNLGHRNAKDKIQTQSISISNSNSDEYKNEKIQEFSNFKLNNQPAPNAAKEEYQFIFSPKGENQHMINTAKDNQILSARLDTEKSMYSDIAGNEAELKQNEIHQFENSNPKGQSQLNQ